MIGRRGFLGGLLALPFAAKVAPEIAKTPVPNVVPKPAVRMFAYRTTGSQNVGSFMGDSYSFPMPTGPTTHQAFHNTSDMDVTLAGSNLVLKAGKAAYVRGGRLVHVKPPKWSD